MGIACVLTLAIYIYEMYLIWSQKYFVSRTYLTVTENVNFEDITSQKIMYFLYKNTTEGAEDADSTTGLTTIVEHV